MSQPKVNNKKALLFSVTAEFLNAMTDLIMKTRPSQTYKPDLPDLIERFENISAEVPMDDEEAEEVLKDAGIDAPAAYERLCDKLQKRDKDKGFDYVKALRHTSGALASINHSCSDPNCSKCQTKENEKGSDMKVIMDKKGKRLIIEKCKAKDIGSCDFCDTGMADEYGSRTDDTIYELPGDRLKMRICEKCLLKLKAI